MGKSCALNRLMTMRAEDGEKKAWQAGFEMGGGTFHLEDNGTLWRLMWLDSERGFCCCRRSEPPFLL